MPKKRPATVISSSSSDSSRSVRSKTSSMYSQYMSRFRLEVSSDSASINSDRSHGSFRSLTASSVHDPDDNGSQTETFSVQFNEYTPPIEPASCNGTEFEPNRMYQFSNANVPHITDNQIFKTASTMQHDLSPEVLYQDSCDICSIQVARNKSSKIGIRSAALQMYHYKFLLVQTKVERLKPKSWSMNLGKYLYLHTIRLNEDFVEYISVCSICRACLKDRMIPQFSILNNVFPEPLPHCMNDKNELSLAESIAVAKVCRF